jgi:multidrug efflux pump subunit AcrA (membrane-fusion protein)
VEILIGTAPRSVVVPREAVEFASGTRKGAVLVVDEAKIAHRRAVEGGELFDAKVQITQGLAAGEVVVVEGGYGLPDGTAVRLAEDGEP